MKVTADFGTGSGKRVEQLGDAHFRLEMRRDKRVYENYFHFRVEGDGYDGEATVDIYPDLDFVPGSRRILETHFSPATLWCSPTGPFPADPGGWRPYPQHLIEWRRDFIRVRLWLEPNLVLYLSSHHPIVPEKWGELLRRKEQEHSGLCRCVSMGQTPEGRPIEGVIIGDGMKRVVVIAAEHPIETPGSWATWGIIDYLTSSLREARALLEGYQFECFPVINVDGLVHGNACFNSTGVDLFTAYGGVPEWRFPAEEARLVWEHISHEPLAALFDFHCYMGGSHTQDYPGEGIYTIPAGVSDAILPPKAAWTYRVMNDRVIFAADPFSSYYRTVDLTPENLCYQLALQHGVPSVVYEFNGAHNGPYRNTRNGIKVFCAAMEGLREAP